MCDVSTYVPDWLKAAQSFGTLALFAVLGALGAVAVYAFVPDSAGDMRILGACFATVGMTCKFFLSVVIIISEELQKCSHNSQLLMK